MPSKAKLQEKKKLSYIDENISKLFDIKKRLGKGAYGIVWKALDKRTNETLAVKKIFDAFRDETDAQRTFREISFLQSFRPHPNVIKLLNVYRAANNLDIYLVFEYMESDLHNIIKKGTILKDIHKRFVMYQLLNAIRYMHSGNVIHRDLKPSNVLIDSKCRCKLADFGLARSLSSQPLKDAQESTEIPPLLTDYVATRWYRAPEILVASKRYTKGIDMWSLGCILGEMIRGKPLFQGSSTINQIEKIISALPDITEREINAVGASFGSVLLSKQTSTERKTSLEELIPEAPNDALDMVKSLLLLDPLARLTANEAIDHPYVQRFRHSVPEVELDQDILPPFRDDIRLTVSEYRSKLYEIAQSTNDKPPPNPPVTQVPKRHTSTSKATGTSNAIKRTVPPAQPPKPRETKYLERTVSENPQIGKRISRISLNRAPPPNVLTNANVIEESVNPNPNPARKTPKPTATTTTTITVSPTFRNKPFEAHKAPNRNRIYEDLRNVSISQNHTSEKKVHQSRNRTPVRSEYLNGDSKRHSFDGGYGSLPVDTVNTVLEKGIQPKICKSSSITKMPAAESYNHLQQPQRIEKTKPPTPKLPKKNSDKYLMQRSSSATNVKASRYVNNSHLDVSKGNLDSYESPKFCYDARIKKIEAAVAGFKDDIKKFAKESKYHHHNHHHHHHHRSSTPTKNVPNINSQYIQPTQTRYPQVRSKYTAGNVGSMQSVTSSKISSMHQMVPAEGGNIILNVPTTTTTNKRHSITFSSLQREKSDFSMSNHTGGSGDHIGRNQASSLEIGKSNDRYKYISKTQHHLLQQQQQQQSRHRISSKVI